MLTILIHVNNPWIKNCFLFCFKGSSSYFDKQISSILLESQQNPVDFLEQNPVVLMNRSSQDGFTIRKVQVLFLGAIIGQYFMKTFVFENTESERKKIIAKKETSQMG
jgi:hypothetical protein